MLAVTHPIFNYDRPDYVRTHPWGKTDYEEDGGRYFDFLKHPERIREVLEDYYPHSDQPAIQKFYELVEWLNRDGGLLETTDCALRPPTQNQDIFKFDTAIRGRLEFLLRNHIANTNTSSILWTVRMLSLYLQVERPDYQDAIFSISTIPTDYVLVPNSKGAGFRVSIAFDAYGNGDTDTWESLLIAFDALLKALKRLEIGMTVSMPDFP